MTVITIVPSTTTRLCASGKPKKLVLFWRVDCEPLGGVLHRGCGLGDWRVYWPFWHQFSHGGIWPWWHEDHAGSSAFFLAQPKVPVHWQVLGDVWHHLQKEEAQSSMLQTDVQTGWKKIRHVFFHRCAQPDRLVCILINLRYNFIIALRYINYAHVTGMFTA